MLKTTSDAHVTDAMFGSAERFSIDTGTSASGVRTVLVFEGRTMTMHKTQDMEPILQHVQAMRERNQARGSKWGELHEVGHIPELFYQPIINDPDKHNRKKRIRAFFKQYPAFCAEPRYLKD